MPEENENKTAETSCASPESTEAVAGKDIGREESESYPEGFIERVSDELSEIREYDPRIKTVSDFASMKNFAQFREYVSKGLTYSEAYKLANYGDITETLKRRQAPVSGRSHLTRTPMRGGGEYDVPQSVMEYYRAMNPGATDSEIRRSWNKYRQSK